MSINPISYKKQFMKSLELATDVIKKLVRAGYIAYFAGGWVRDYVMQHPSDDIDIATNAPPEVILDLFPRTILVGLAFGVVIVSLDGHQFEVSTFRKDINYKNGRKPEKIELASPEEDAQRRDFTINGMFYDPLENKIHDFVHGMEDIQRRIIRTIGSPDERFLEDRLRMIRAVRFAARFDFAMDVVTQEAIKENSETLFPAVAMERIWQEFTKMSAFPHFDKALVELHRLNLLPVIFPALKGIHLNEIKKRVEPLAHFLPGFPTILFLPELFPDASLDTLIDICRYLKVSSREIGLIEFMFKLRQYVFKDPHLCELEEWARLYAHRDFPLCLELIAARYSGEQRALFLSAHHDRQARVRTHAQRIRERKPLVTSALLIAHGVSAGKQMGALLKEAENISIRHDLHDPEEVINRLRKSPLWPKETDEGTN